MIREFDIVNIIAEKIIEHKSVLDIGCGNGRHLFPFSKLGFDKLVGFDITDENKRYVFSQFVRFKSDYERVVSVEKNEEFLNGDKGIDLKTKREEFYMKEFFPTYFEEFTSSYNFNLDSKNNFLSTEFENKFDVVLFINVIHFVPHELQIDYIEKIKNLLTNHGLLVFIANTSTKCCQNGFINNLEMIRPKVYKGKSKTYHLLDNNDIDKILSRFKNHKEFKNEKWNKNARQFMCWD